MGGKGSGRKDRTTELLNNSSVQKFTPIADNDIFIPNHSGDHSAGRVLTTPTTNYELVNKKYVDDKMAASDAFVEIAGDTMTGALIINNLTLDSGSITDSSGAISFGNENLTTTGTLNSATITTVGLGIIGGDLQINGGDITSTSGSMRFTGLAVTVGTLTNGQITISEDDITSNTGQINFGNENLATTGTLASGSITATGSVDATVDIDTPVHRISGSNALDISNTNFRIGAGTGAGGSTLIHSGGGTLALSIDSSQNFDFQDGNLTTTGTINFGNDLTLTGNGQAEGDKLIFGGNRPVHVWLDQALGASSGNSQNLYFSLQSGGGKNFYFGEGVGNYNNTDFNANFVMEVGSTNDQTNAKFAIGKDNPTEALDVVGNAKITGANANLLIRAASELDFIYNKTNAGAAVMDFQSLPSDGTSSSNYRFGLASGSTGANTITIFKPNGSSVFATISTNSVVFNEGGDDVDFRIEGVGHTSAFFVEGSSGDIGLGTTSPDAKLDIAGTIKIAERAEAESDTAGKGQLWVKNNNPCELWFTDDNGGETQITNLGGLG